MSFLNSLFEGLQTFGSEMTDWGPAVGELTDIGRQALGEGVELAQRRVSADREIGSASCRERGSFSDVARCSK